jgi:AcrR family transcriptional regulator
MARAVQTKGEGASRSPLRDRQRVFTKEQLLAAAIEVFAQSSYATATVEDIAKGAGTSRPTFYQHFRSKADIAVELVTWLMDEVQPLHQELYATPELTWATLRQWLGESIDTWQRVRIQASVVRQAAVLDPNVSSLLAGHAVVLSDALAEFVRSRNPGLHRESARIQATLLLTQFDAALEALRLVGIAVRGDRTLDALADSWWPVLSGVPTVRATPKRRRRAAS